MRCAALVALSLVRLIHCATVEGLVLDIIPYAIFNEAFNLIEYCIADDGDGWDFVGISSRNDCLARGGQIDVRPGYETDPENVYNLKVAQTLNIISDNADKRAVWVALVANTAAHIPAHFQVWEELTDSVIDRVAVNQGRIFCLVHATATHVAMLRETGYFSSVMPLPEELKVHPSVIVRHKYAAATIGSRPPREEDWHDLHITLATSKQPSNRVKQAQLGSTKPLHPYRLPCKAISDCHVESDGSDVLRLRSIHVSSLKDAASNILPEYPSAIEVTLVPRLIRLNYNAHWLVQSNSAPGAVPFTPLWDAGLHGENIIVAVADDGLDYMSCYFYDSSVPVTFTNNVFTSTQHRKLVQYIGYADTTQGEDAGHGTHVSGSVLGKTDSSTESKIQQNGMAYEAKLAFFDIGLPNAASLSVPINLYTDFFPYAKSAGASIQSNSWGSASNSYTAYSSQVDQYTYTNQDFLVLFAAGNAGSGANTVGSPATGKNQVSVAATQNIYGSASPDLAYFSSRGTTADGRTKPTVAAPGYYITSANSKASPTVEHCSTVQMAGTSMATPVTAGLAALVQQYFQEGFYPTGEQSSQDEITPMAALIHAILVNSGRRMTGTEANRNGGWKDQGWGMVQADATVFLMGYSSDFDLYVDGEFGSDCDKCPVFTQSGQSMTYQFTLYDDSHPFKVTLVYHDYPGASGSITNVLVNDLDLRVYEGSSSSAQAVNALTAGTRDTLNNVEQVWLTSPTVGATYTVTVEATTIVKSQPFALVVTGNFYKDDTLFPGYVPIVTSTAYANGQVLLWGQKFGDDLEYIAADLACAEGAVVTPVALSDGVILLNVSTTCSTLSGGLFARTFYTTLSDIVWEDISIAKKCSSLDSSICAVTLDCRVSGNNCEVSQSAKDRTGYSDDDDTSSDSGSDSAAIAVGVLIPVLAIAMGALFYVLYKKNRTQSASARNTTPAVATASHAQPPVVAVQAAVPMQTMPITPQPRALPKPPKPSAPSAQLPPDWQLVHDETTGRDYYWNVKTNATSWERPLR